MRHFAGPWGRGGRGEPPPPADDAPAWLTGALPDDWFTERPDITIDRDEILIIGRLPEPDLGEDATAAERSSGEAGRIASFREATRERRIGIAKQAEHRYRRKVWHWQRVMGHPVTLTLPHPPPALADRVPVWRRVADRTWTRAHHPPHARAWRCIQRFEARWTR